MEKEFTSIYFNSTTKTVISSKYDLDESFQEILQRIGNWINEGSCWVIESMDREYVNIFIYSPLSRTSYNKLPNKLKSLMKGLTNIKINENNCFPWCHIRQLNPLKIHPEKIEKADIKNS